MLTSAESRSILRSYLRGLSVDQIANGALYYGRVDRDEVKAAIDAGLDARDKRGVCNRCTAAADGAVSCDECGKCYRRCDDCDGVEGARRSLHSHKGLVHPRSPGESGTTGGGK